MHVRQIVIASISLLSVGCADLYEFTNSNLASSRNWYLARASWGANARTVGSGCKNQCDFRDGYIQAYFDVASGLQGCPPVLPPERYWGACYQDGCGHSKINDWFAGYNEGLAAASRDGVGYAGMIPTWCNPDQNCQDERFPFVAPPGRPNEARKPRRGDPPIRAHLPPDETATPESSTEKKPEAKGDDKEEPLPTTEKSEEPMLPMNPFSRPITPTVPKKEKSEFPSAPPVISEKGIKSSTALDASTPKPTRVVDESNPKPMEAAVAEPLPTPLDEGTPESIVKKPPKKPESVTPVRSEKTKPTSAPRPDADNEWATPHDGPKR